MITHLREIHDHDHEFLVELHNDPDVLRNLTNPAPITMEGHLRWFASIQNNPRERRFIFEVDGSPVGLTKFYSIDRENNNCVLGADLHRNFRGKRLATPMWTLMLNFSFYALDLYRVSLTTAEYNHIAQRVYRNLGFKDEGKLIQSLYRDGQYWDQLSMYMLKTDWDHGQTG